MTFGTKSVFLLLLLLCLSVSPAAAEALLQIRLGTVVPAGSRNFLLTEKILREAFRRNNLHLLLEPLPGKRSLIEADAGRIDGDALRIYQVGERYENLLRVPEPVRTLKIYVYTRDSFFHVGGWRTLAPYRVITKRGIKIVEEKLKGVMYRENIVETGTYEAAFKMLLKGRGDLVIASPEDAGAILQKEIFRNSGIHPLPFPVDTISLYVYLHTRHLHLVPGVAASLKAMKNDGTYAGILNISDF